MDAKAVEEHHLRCRPRCPSSVPSARFLSSVPEEVQREIQKGQGEGPGVGAMGVT